MKKVFVVVVSDYGCGHLESPEVFHIRALDKDKAVECVKDIFANDYTFEQETIEEDLDFFAYELDEDAIIEA
jgi:hypothetical protein